ncbi:hypothetical protein [Glycomyces sp. NPDC021274]|uniref:hypothetical protein n=1 Tax=Glycomyces sp. NPDC021274 TaxID=3155120 RepID=UPI0033E6CE62
MIDDNMFKMLDHMAGPSTGIEEGAEPEQKREAKKQIGALMAEIVVAKVATGLISKQAAEIRAGVEGDKSLAVSLGLFGADCESKLQRIVEGWDHNPSDTRFAYRRDDITRQLTKVHEAAQGISDLTGALINAFRLPEENQ